MLAEATRTGVTSVALTSTRAASKARPTRTARILRLESRKRAGSLTRAGAVATSDMLVVVNRIIRDRVVRVVLVEVHGAVGCGDEELAHHVVVLVRQVVAVDH